MFRVSVFSCCYYNCGMCVRALTFYAVSELRAFYVKLCNDSMKLTLTAAWG